MNFSWDIFNSEWGPILLISSQKGLVRLSLPTQNPKKILDHFMMNSDSILTYRENSVIRKTKKQLHQYFNKQRKTFLISLDLRGTDFQKAVWFALCQTPFGATTSYQSMAEQVGSPKACRAVGMANHLNPIPIIIPCHRVIAKDGSLGGYADNSANCLKLKKDLLALEQAALEKERTGYSMIEGLASTGFFDSQR